MASSWPHHRLIITSAPHHHRLRPPWREPVAPLECSWREPVASLIDSYRLLACPWRACAVAHAADPK
tara:strand:+ start:308 stop:508 length:201 start_codon:yes stop_codon:yes gene_type:complete